MIVKVTKQDIENGLRCDVHNCPIAQALNRQSKASDIWVWSRTAVVDDVKYHLPSKAQEFIQFFDMGYVLEPFQFNLQFKVEPEVVKKSVKAKKPSTKMVKQLNDFIEKANKNSRHLVGVA